MVAGKGFKERSGALLDRFRAWPKWLRIPAGVALVIGGALGFLPVLGFWMLPLGLAVLAVDIPLAAKAYHRVEHAVEQSLQKLRRR